MTETSSPSGSEIQTYSGPGYLKFWSDIAIFVDYTQVFGIRRHVYPMRFDSVIRNDLTVYGTRFPYILLYSISLSDPMKESHCKKSVIWYRIRNYPSDILLLCFRLRSASFLSPLDQIFAHDSDDTGLNQLLPLQMAVGRVAMPIVGRNVGDSLVYHLPDRHLRGEGISEGMRRDLRLPMGNLMTMRLLSKIKRTYIPRYSNPFLPG